MTRRARRRRRRRRASPCRRARSPRAAGSPSPARGSPTSIVEPRRSCRPGARGRRRRTSISKCTVRVAASAAGARRLIVRRQLGAGRLDGDLRPACPARRRRSRPRARRRRCAPCCDRRRVTTGLPGRTKAPGSTKRVGDLAVERRAQDAVVDLERCARRARRACSATSAFSAADFAVFCSTSFGDTKPPASSSLVRSASCCDGLLARLDARAPARRFHASPPRRCGSRAWRGPRRA